MTNFMYAFYMHHSSSGRIDIFVHLFSNFTWIGLFHYLGFNLFIDLTYFYWLHVLGIDQYKINAFYLLLSTSTKSSNWRSSSRYFSFLIHMCYFGQKNQMHLVFGSGLVPMLAPPLCYSKFSCIRPTRPPMERDPPALEPASPHTHAP
jgi:hypothetical protein